MSGLKLLFIWELGKVYIFFRDFKIDYIWNFDFFIIFVYVVKNKWDDVKMKKM